MIRVERNVLFDLGLIYAFQYRQPVPDTSDSHFLQFLVFKSNESLADDFIFYPSKNKLAILPPARPERDELT